MTPEHYIPPILVTMFGVIAGLVGVIFRGLSRRIAICEKQVQIPVDLKEENLITIAIETRNNVRHIMENCVMCAVPKEREQ